MYCGTFHSSHLGYQSSYEKYSPGTFLMIRAMEEMCKESVQELILDLAMPVTRSASATVTGTR